MQTQPLTLAKGEGDRVKDMVGDAIRSAQAAFPNELYLETVRVRARQTAPSIKMLLGLPAAAIGLVMAATYWVNRPATCGGQVMGAGDRCVSYRSGMDASAAQVANAPIHQPALWLVIIAIVLAIWIWQMRAWLRYRKHETQVYARSCALAELALARAMATPGAPELHARLADYAAAVAQVPQPLTQESQEMS